MSNTNTTPATPESFANEQVLPFAFVLRECFSPLSSTLFADEILNAQRYGYTTQMRELERELKNQGDTGPIFRRVCKLTSKAIALREEFRNLPDS